jgi:uncharacterized protein YecT (DUF1311 family)
MKLETFTLTVVFISFASAASADNSACEGKSNFEQVQCISKRLQDLDRELNRVYKLALEAMPEKSNSDHRKEQEQLRKSQRAWLKYKDDNCALVGGLEGGSNLWVTHFAGLCEEKEVSSRIVFLKGIADGKYLH